VIVNVTAVIIAAIFGALVGGTLVAVGLRARRRDDDANVAQILADLVELAANFAPPDRRETVRRLANLIAERWQPDGHHAIADPAPPVVPTSADAVNRTLRQRRGW
jgi:hypothetical protein